MNPVQQTSRRPLPSFVEWLEQTSPDTKAPDFEPMADLARRTQDQSPDGLKPHEASFLRMWTGALIAAVELCNMEALKHERPNGEIIATLPRVFATATMYAIASVCKPETPFRQIAKVVTEEYRAAAKVAADTLTAGDMSDQPEELQDFKAFAIQRSRDPTEGLDARGRAIMACIVLPAPIQKWIIEADALEPLIDSLTATIVAAEQHERERSAEMLAELKRLYEKHGYQATADIIAKAEGSHTPHDGADNG